MMFLVTDVWRNTRHRRASQIKRAVFLLVASGLGIGHTLWNSPSLYDYLELDVSVITLLQNRGGDNRTSNIDVFGVKVWPLKVVIDREEEVQTELAKKKETQSNENSSIVNITTSSSDWRGYKNRTIILTHVGKAGGLTLRRATSLICRQNSRARNRTEDETRGCVEHHFSPNATLSRQVKHYFHMFAYHEEELKHSTSFLFPLRNPVDRAISSYRYSHPENCLKGIRGLRPWGCRVAERWKKPGVAEYLAYTTCFPSPGMEDFAQSTMSPWRNNTHFDTLSSNEQRMCRRLARRMLEGKGPNTPNPHMWYNYFFYHNKTVARYPEKEMFGVRTTHEWEDIIALDKAVGGTAEFRKKGHAASHGSEKYYPSPLSEEAYHKLCCVLNDEIALYEDLIHRVLNFDDTVKQECIDEVRQKCGITMSWDDWRQQCRTRLAHDTQSLLMQQRNELSKSEEIQLHTQSNYTQLSNLSQELRRRLNLTIDNIKKVEKKS